MDGDEQTFRVGLNFSYRQKKRAYRCILLVSVHVLKQFQAFQALFTYTD